MEILLPSFQQVWVWSSFKCRPSTLGDRRKDRFHIVLIALNMQGILKFDYDSTLQDVEVARMHNDRTVKHTCVVVSPYIIEGRDFFTFWISSRLGDGWGVQKIANVFRT